MNAPVNSSSPASTPRVLPDEKLEPDREPLYARNMDDAAVAAGDDPVHHLRLFSNYLTPRKGLLSGDTWRAVAVVSRNLILTWLVLVPIVLGAILAGQLYYVLQPFDPDVARAFARHHITHRAASPAPVPAGGVVRAGDVRIEGPASVTFKADATQPSVVLDWPVIYRRTAVALELLVIPFAALVVITVVWMRLNNAGNALTHAASFLAVLLMGPVSFAVLSLTAGMSPFIQLALVVMAGVLSYAAVLWWLERERLLQMARVIGFSR
jgi:hypothetical protein